MTIYIYSNETGKQVDAIQGADNNECERLAEDKWGSNEHHFAYTGAPVSNAVFHPRQSVESECQL